jgi:hypothetical protein
MGNGAATPGSRRSGSGLPTDGLSQTRGLAPFRWSEAAFPRPRAGQPPAYRPPPLPGPKPGTKPMTALPLPNGKPWLELVVLLGKDRDRSASTTC